jgi:DNA-binding transcriptional MerR regulator
MTIGELAEHTGIATRTLRYYESLDLLIPVTRSVGNYRLYGEDAVREAAIIQVLKQVNVPLDTIRTFLNVQKSLGAQERGQAVSEILDDTLKKTRQYLAQLTRLVSDLESALAISHECARCPRSCDLPLQRELHSVSQDLQPGYFPLKSKK